MAGERLSKMESSDDRSFLQVHLWHSTARKMTYPLFYSETFQAIRKLSRLSRNFPGYPEIFRIIRKISSLSGNFPGSPETFQAIQKLSGSSGKYPAYSETFQAIWKLSRLSRNFPDHPETIQPIWKLSRLSGNFPDYPETFRTIRKILGLSEDFLDHPENIRTIRRLSGPSGNFPDNMETSQCNFKGYAQKLSGRAKTFRVAMPPCHPGFCASALRPYLNNKPLVESLRGTVTPKSPSFVSFHMAILNLGRCK